jgi:hypothetical protein
MDELDEQIEKLEKEWELYHRDSNNPMPNMVELVKLRLKRERLRNKKL